MALRDLTQALTSSAVAQHRGPIYIQWLAPDVPAFEPGPAHTCPDPFDDEVALELGDGADDDHHRAAQRAAGVQVLAEADELDLEMVQLIEYLEEVPDGPGDPVRGPDQQHLEAATPRIAEQVVQTRSPGLGPGDPVGVLGDDLKSALLGHGPDIVQLCLRMLVDGGHSHVNRRCLHNCSSIAQSSSFMKARWI